MAMRPGNVNIGFTRSLSRVSSLSAQNSLKSGKSVGSKSSSSRYPDPLTKEALQIATTIYAPRNEVRMIRNPFAKEDGGCSFICFFAIFAIVQIAFVVIFIQNAY